MLCNQLKLCHGQILTLIINETLINTDTLVLYQLESHTSLQKGKDEEIHQHQWVSSMHLQIMVNYHLQICQIDGKWLHQN